MNRLQIAILIAGIVGAGLTAAVWIARVVNQEANDHVQSCVFDTGGRHVELDYDAIADHDIYITQAHVLFDQDSYSRCRNLLDSLRIRNPDIHLLAHTPLYLQKFQVKAVAESTVTSGWHYDYATNLASYMTGSQDASTYSLDLAEPRCRAILLAIWRRYIEVGEATGLFFDYMPYDGSISVYASILAQARVLWPDLLLVGNGRLARESATLRQMLDGVHIEGSGIWGYPEGVGSLLDTALPYSLPSLCKELDYVILDNLWEPEAAVALSQLYDNAYGVCNPPYPGHGLRHLYRDPAPVPGWARELGRPEGLAMVREGYCSRAFRGGLLVIETEGDLMDWRVEE